ncbi:MAG: S-layer homology domain-containing protein [Firmicutes bacterium]|nr:S-layer homology domain-containing protein [Bacillota bacterium]
MKKIIALLLCLCLLLGNVSAVSAISFSDVPEGTYYYEPVYNIAWSGIINGFPDGTFGPGKPITREQMAVMLVNMQKLSPYTPSTAKFPDVPSTRWSYKYVEAAAKAGFISGYPDGTFKPDRNVSYNEAITMIVALMGYKLADLGGTYPTAFTNKARDLGILNTCAMLGDSAASRANVSCFIRDAILSSQGDQDVFKHKGTNYKVTLGSDFAYYVEQGSSRTDGYGITLFIENTSSSPIPYSATSFTAEFDGRTYLVDTASYDAFDGYSVPNGTIYAGQTAKVVVFFACGKNPSKGVIRPNLSSGNEAEIELNFQ